MDQPEKEYFGPTNYEPTQPAGTPATITTTPEVEYKKDSLSQKIKKSVIDFLFTFPFMVAYIGYAPKLLMNLIPDLSEKLALLISGLLFMVIIGIIYFTWGEHWPVGRKKIGFALTSLTMVVVALMQIYYNNPAPSMGVFILERGKVKNFTLTEKGLTTPWIEVPKGVVYNIHTKKNTPYRVYYSNGTKVDIPSGKSTELPDIYPTKFKIVNLGDEAEDYTISGM